MIAMRRSTVETRQVGITNLEKSAAGDSRSCLRRPHGQLVAVESILMISAARMPLSCFTSAFGAFQVAKDVAASVNDFDVLFALLFQ